MQARFPTFGQWEMQAGDLGSGYSAACVQNLVLSHILLLSQESLVWQRWDGVQGLSPKFITEGEKPASP